MLKKFLIGTVIIAIAVLALKAALSDKYSKNESEIHALGVRFGDDMYFAFFSLKELRPYSIIQFDKTIDAYNNTWVEPDSLITMLSKDQRDTLTTKVVNYLNSLPEKESSAIISKINNWCIAYRQLTFLTKIMRISNENLLNACMKIDYFNDGLSFIKNRDSLISKNISYKEVNQGLNEITNTLSGISTNRQLLYYSRIYSELYLIASAEDSNR